MLGYGSEAELLAANLLRDVFGSVTRAHIAPAVPANGVGSDGVETEWQRKDGTPVPVRLSGRAVLDEHGACKGSRSSPRT